MREIKFRALYRGKIYPVLHLIVEKDKVSTVIIEMIDDDLVKSDGSPLKTEKVVSGNHAILMQYTGLKDKNGKEIYEGDIIRESDGDGGYIYAKVVYYKDGFMGKEKGFEPEYPISDFKNETEVIGNIYENPELLEG